MLCCQHRQPLIYLVRLFLFACCPPSGGQFKGSDLVLWSVLAEPQFLVNLIAYARVNGFTRASRVSGLRLFWLLPPGVAGSSDRMFEI